MPIKKFLRIGAVVVASVLVVALIAGSVVVFYLLRKPLPTHSGQLTVDGLRANVEVKRNSLGVVEIYADTPRDLFMAQGFVNAQDRFFEMDYRRHLTSGRLAELVGNVPSAIAADKVIRTMGWRLVAEREWEMLDQATKSYLQAYSDGVNAYLSSRDLGSLALEYTVLGMNVKVSQPQPWNPVDSLAWLKAMAWDLRSNYDDELGRAELFRTLHSVEAVNALYPPYSDEHRPILPAADQVATPGATPTHAAVPPTINGAGASFESGVVGGQDGQQVDWKAATIETALSSAQEALKAVPHLVGEGEGIGSNSWVISGELSATGAPLLANDPHLAVSAPGVWSQMGLHCRTVSNACPFDVSGFTFAGFPGVIIGHNSKLAWGFTNMGADVTDFVLESTNSDGSYQYDNASRPFTTREETINVNGADPINMTVRSTVHGPIISDVLDTVKQAGSPPSPLGDDQAKYDVALQWTALTPSQTAAAVFLINTAASAADIKTAAAKFAVPAQNIVFATTDGHIGYQAPGRVPIREQVPDAPVPNDGTWPRPGWDKRFDWKGFVPAAQMPAVLDPAEGFIVTANQQVQPEGAGPFLATDWDYGYRSERIRSLIQSAVASKTPITTELLNQWQLDSHNPAADVLIPYLDSVKVSSDFLREPVEMLKKWDRSNDADSPAAAFFAAFYAEVLRMAFADQLPSELAPDGGSRWIAVLEKIVKDENATWWDDRGTVNIVENRNEVLGEALKRARIELTTAISKDPQEWSWGKLHTLTLKHPVLGGDSVPGLVRAVFDPQPIAVSGGSASVNATNWNAGKGYVTTSGPSMRMVVSLGNFDASTWVNLTGTSGHPGSVHYTDQIAAWAAGKTYTWAFSSPAVDAATTNRLVLTTAR